MKSSRDHASPSDPPKRTQAKNLRVALLLLVGGVALFLVLRTNSPSPQETITEGGDDATVATPAQHESIDTAIARNDLPAVRRHLAVDPQALNQGDHPTLTPLHQAILRQRTEIAALLIEAGADMQKPDQNDRTPLHLAVERNLVEIARMLVERGVNLSALDNRGWTPLHHATARNNFAISKILLEGGHDIQQLSRLGGTPLHEAAVQGDERLLQLVLDAGVDPTVVSSTGMTALDVAKESGNEVAVKFLSEMLKP